jgi:proline dehydrogenase
LLSTAHQLRVPVLIDAEQSYYQKAIDWLALSLSKRFNKEFPIVYNTYQLYLKDGLTKLQRDMNIAQKDRFFFAAKVLFHLT